MTLPRRPRICIVDAQEHDLYKHIPTMSVGSILFLITPMQSFDTILDQLNTRRQRATYGAVAAVLDRPAAFLMAGRPRDAQHSWIVNAQTLRPTGYPDDAIHPELLTIPKVLADGPTLLAWLAAEDDGVISSREPVSVDEWWHSLTTRELLEGYDGVMRELRRRNVVRSHNNPVADLAEQIGSVAFSLTLAGRSAKGHDGTAADGTRWQIKGRRRTPENQSMQLGAIRNLADSHFEYLLAIYFDSRFEVDAAYQVDLATVQRHAKFGKALNGHVLRPTSAFLADRGCVDVTALVRDAAGKCHSGIFDPAV